ncbi:MAG TPA: periplasmic heavy metal sensor [Oculatellaceae cyanobacterium]
MKFRRILVSAVAPFVVAMPAMAAEQTASISYEDLDTEFLAALPPSSESMAMAPSVDAPTEGEATIAVGVQGPGGHEAGPECGHEHGRHHHGPLSALKGNLALSDDQYEKLYSLRNQFLDQVAAKAVELGTLHRKMKDALTSPNLDAKAVADMGARINTLKSDIAAAKLNRLIASAQVLTPEQRKAIHDQMVHHSVESFGEMGHGMHHHHH